MKKYTKQLKETVSELKKLPLYKMDKERMVLKKGFDLSYKNGLFSLYKFKQPSQEKLKLKLFAKLTPISGSLSFLGIQTLAANAIMNKNKFVKKEFYFKKKCGIAINHLRAPITHVNAKKVKGGYLLNGKLTWASGYKIFDTLLIGFHYKNQEFEVMAPFKITKGFKILSRPDTFVGFSLSTVNITLKNFFVKDEDIVSSNIIGNYNKNKSLSKTIHYTIYGLGKGAINQIKNKEFKKEANSLLKAKKKAFVASKVGQELDILRVELFDLVQDIITTAMVLNGGKSILNDSNLQRYYQELIMFNANGLNKNVKNICLKEFMK